MLLAMMMMMMMIMIMIMMIITMTITVILIMIIVIRMMLVTSPMRMKVMLMIIMMMLIKMMMMMIMIMKKKRIGDVASTYNCSSGGIWWKCTRFVFFHNVHVLILWWIGHKRSLFLDSIRWWDLTSEFLISSRVWMAVVGSVTHHYL